jgi:hypothetical protein
MSPYGGVSARRISKQEARRGFPGSRRDGNERRPPAVGAKWARRNGNECRRPPTGEWKRAIAVRGLARYNLKMRKMKKGEVAASALPTPRSRSTVFHYPLYGGQSLSRPSRRGVLCSKTPGANPHSGFAPVFTVSKYIERLICEPSNNIPLTITGTLLFLINGFSIYFYV